MTTANPGTSLPDTVDATIPSQATLPAGTTYIGAIGPIVATGIGTITVADGDGDHTFKVNSQTVVEKAIDRGISKSNNVALLRAGDAATVAGFKSSSDSVVAIWITINYYHTRPAIVKDIHGDVVTVSMSLDNGGPSSEYSVVVTDRFAIDAKSHTAIRASDLYSGQRISLQSFRDDDGTFVAVLIDR